MSRHTPAYPPRRRRRRLAGAGLAAAMGTAAGCLAFEAAALTPGTGVVGFVCSVLLPTLAPHLLLAAALGGAAAWAVRRRLPRAARAAGAANLLATALPAVVLGGSMVAAGAAGGAVNPVAALAIGSMQSPPDAVATYAPGPTGALEIYRPAGAAGGAPILFDVHGGGWKSDARMPATLRWFADRGRLVVRPAYSLASPGHPTADRVPGELACAYAWTAAHARELGGDPRRITVFGDSAGGGLGIDLAYGIAAGRVSSPCGALPRPRAVVALYPTVDPAAVAGVRLFDAGRAAVDYLGGTPAQVPDRYRAADARTWITPAAPPTLVVQGTRDHFVPPDSVRAFVAAARAAGVATRLVEVPLADHAFDAQASGSVGLRLVTSVAEAFLADHADPVG